MRKYQPSNGTEGEWFMGKFCDQCIHEHPKPDVDPECEIIILTMGLSVNHKDYPEEWCYNENDKPTCTKFQKWDWGNDYDGFNEPPEPELIDPNQLMLFSITDEILKQTTIKKLELELVD